LFSTDFPSLPANEAWEFNESQLTNNGNDIVYKMNSGEEWGPMFSLELSDAVKSRHVIIDVTIDVEGKLADTGVLVCQIYSEDAQIQWKGSNKADYFDRFENTGWTTIHLSTRLAEVLKSNAEISGTTLKINYWNKGKNEARIKDFKVRIRTGNSKIYGLYQKMED